MVSFDGAEVYELVGLYIEPKLEKMLPKSNFGLYRDDGLALLGNLNGQETYKVRKNIIRLFKDIGFSLDIKTNSKKQIFYKFYLFYEMVLIVLTKSQTI